MGSPPGGGMAAGQRKGGPPVALMVGGGCGCLAVLAVIVLVIFVVSRRSGGDDAPTPTAERPPASPGPATPTGGGGDPIGGSVYKRIPSTNVAVPVAHGWREDRVSFYTRAIAPSRDAVIAFTTVSSYGEWAGRTQHAFRAFNIDNCSWQAATRGRLGPSSLPCRLREGQCTWNGVPAHVATVLVESGRRAFPLVFYGVANSASATVKQQAKQTVLGMKVY